MFWVLRSRNFLKLLKSVVLNVPGVGCVWQNARIDMANPAGTDWVIELLERSGFEIGNVGPAFEYRDQRFLRHWISARWPALLPIARAVLALLPDPLLVSSGSIRIIARRRAGPPLNVRAIRSVEPTHAR